MIKHRQATLFNEGSYNIDGPAICRIFRIIVMGFMAVLAFDKSIATTMVRAQEPSTNDDDSICGCSAPTYTFVLDFGLSCPPTNITTGPGVSSVSCLISPLGAPTDKFAPVAVDSISVIELNQLNSVLVEEIIDSEFVDGDSFSYSSIINNQEDITNIQSVPKALQLTLRGRNEDGVILINVFVITFSNACGETPVIQAGDSAGWIVFSEMGGPIPSFCPTKAPSETPSDSPTEIPTQQPTQPPSKSPTIFPTQNPTNNPTSQPTVRRTDEPTQKPTEPLTQQPTVLPTNEPTQKPTEPPTQKPTSQVTSQPTALTTDDPTRRPTEPLTQETTGKPVSLPTGLPTDEPTLCPSMLLEQMPTPKPSPEPTGLSTDGPSLLPTMPPVQKPTGDQTLQDTKQPTNKPTKPLLPTQIQTDFPFSTTTKFPTSSPTKSAFPTSSLFPSTTQSTMSMSMSLSTSFEMEYSDFFEREIEIDIIKEILND